ncbi:MAG: DUF2975 domain-containing protein [Terracidiphilus sp.]|jgi:hypothetical protein
MLEKDKLIRTSRLVVKTGLLINRLFLAAVMVGLLLSFIFASQMAAMLVPQGPDVRSVITGLRLEMLLGIAMAVAIDRLFVALAQIIETVREGDPFIHANARRLQTIGWALMVLQLLNLPSVLIERSFPSLGTGTPGFDFSAGGWLAVLMVFVLSRVFAAGSAMRDELEGTI